MVRFLQTLEQHLAYISCLKLGIGPNNLQTRFYENAKEQDDTFIGSVDRHDSGYLSWK